MWLASRAPVLPSPLSTWNHAWWEASLLNECTQGQRGEGRLFRGFEDEDITSGESWSGFEANRAERPIPRYNTGCDAEGFVSDDFEEAVLLRVGFTSEFVDPASTILEKLVHVSYIPYVLGNWSAGEKEKPAGMYLSSQADFKLAEGAIWCAQT
jgi:hypothetical protein